jgi:hypothetical protein
MENLRFPANKRWLPLWQLHACNCAVAAVGRVILVGAKGA